MATLLIISQGFDNPVIQLNLGINRLGRSPENDFQINHPTVSARHCEIVSRNGELVVRDCASTNGTFIGGKPVAEGVVWAREVLRLGDVELLVESNKLHIAIPRFDVARPAPPVILEDGSLVCPRHAEARVTHQCTFCHEVLCGACVHRLRRRGGKLLELCPLCSHRVEPLGAQRKQKKKSFLAFLQKTIKLPFVRADS